jgi:hypothetical protein
MPEAVGKRVRDIGRRAVFSRREGRDADRQTGACGLSGAIWGLRPRRAVQALALARPSVLPSAQCTASASRGCCFRGSIPSLCAPLSTLRRHPRGGRRMTRGLTGRDAHSRRSSRRVRVKSEAPSRVKESLAHGTSSVSGDGRKTCGAASHSRPLSIPCQ